MRFRERLWPTPWMFVFSTLVIPAALVVFLPIDPRVGVVVAIALYLAIVVVFVVTTPTIEVDAEELRAGRARLPLSVVSDAVPYRKHRATLERGRRLDARAWLLIRGWVDPVVRIDLDDPDDPTPYWLVSTRRPEELASLLSTRSMPSD